MSLCPKSLFVIVVQMCWLLKIRAYYKYICKKCTISTCLYGFYAYIIYDENHNLNDVCNQKYCSIVYSLICQAMALKVFFLSCFRCLVHFLRVIVLCVLMIELIERYLPFDLSSFQILIYFFELVRCFRLFLYTNMYAFHWHMC